MNDYDLLILYGSQTGNAEDVAYRIGREASRRHKKYYVCSCDQYKIQNLVEERFVVFVVSTTGQGDPPDNMKTFWKFIWKKILPNDCLHLLSFAVVALGDSSYDKYNIVGKKLFRRLQQLGASDVMPCCLGDDLHEFGYNAALNPWLSEFWDIYLQQHPVKHDLPIIPDHILLPSRYKVKFISKRNSQENLNKDIGKYIKDETKKHNRTEYYGKNDKEADKENKKKIEKQDYKEENRKENTPGDQEEDTQDDNKADKQTDREGYTRGEVAINKRLTPQDHWQAVHLVSFTSNLTYNPGDVCWVLPSNREDDVREFLSIMDLRGSSLFTWQCDGLSPLDGLPNPCTIHHLFKYHLEISALPREYFWQVMSCLKGEGVGGGDDNDNCGGGDVNNNDGNNNDDGTGNYNDDDASGKHNNDDNGEAGQDNDGSDEKNVSKDNDDDDDDEKNKNEEEEEEAFELEQEKLKEFCSYQNIDDLYDYCYRPRRTILEILRDFPHSRRRLSLSRLFEIIPPIKARPFSIASTPLKNQTSMDLLVAVVEYHTKLKKPRLGLCSNYLASLRPSIDEVQIRVTRGTFKAPPALPLVTVGPGTGCAPFRGILTHRALTGSCDNYLFFGSRNKSKDFFFNEEWTQLIDQGQLHLFTAFSRDQEHKIYVQHVIKKHSDLLFDLIFHKRCHFMLAGSSKDMPKQVKEAIEDVLVEGGVTEASAYVDAMIKEGRYQMEVW